MLYHVADGFLGDCLIKYGALKVTIVAMVHVLPPVQFVVFLAHFHLGASFNFFMDSHSLYLSRFFEKKDGRGFSPPFGVSNFVF